MHACVRAWVGQCVCGGGGAGQLTLRHQTRQAQSCRQHNTIQLHDDRSPSQRPTYLPLAELSSPPLTTVHLECKRAMHIIYYYTMVPMVHIDDIARRPWSDTGTPTLPSHRALDSPTVSHLDGWQYCLCLTHKLQETFRGPLAPAQSPPSQGLLTTTVLHCTTHSTAAPATLRNNALPAGRIGFTPADDGAPGETKREQVRGQTRTSSTTHAATSTSKSPPAPPRRAIGQ
jgi:hypothetical protein